MQETILKNGRQYRSHPVGLELTIHAIKSQIYLVSQSL
jgi:hypothetical protein